MYSMLYNKILYYIIYSITIRVYVYSKLHIIVYKIKCI